MPTPNKTAHTPGPWKVAEQISHGGAQFVRVSASVTGRRKSVALDFPVAAIYKRNEANARLIAAAPELLQTLKDIQHNAAVMCQAEPNPVWIAVDDQCRAAIAKAEGRAS